MALIIEDGSIVAGANTYVSRADYIAFAASVGVAIPDDEAADVELVKAAQFINSKEGRLKGSRVSRDQPLAYPRKDLELEGWSWSSSEIPRQVLSCQLNLALDVHAGVDLFNPAPATTSAVKRKRVEGVVEIEYATSDAPAKMARDSSGLALLNLLMKRSGLQLVRA
jgi:hypothetical protein